jgi:molecular chaperone Hsp33
MKQTDVIQQFYFQDIPVRGALVKLGNSYIEALNGHRYPAVVNALLGQCLAAGTLMNANLKTAARLTLQARGNGPLSLLMAEALLLQTSHDKNSNATIDDTAQQSIRACARINEQTFSQHFADSPQDSGSSPSAHHSTMPNLQQLLGEAQLALTIEASKKERYQSIVAINSDTLAGCLEGYFLQSEQLPTFIKLATSNSVAAGLLLQQMPEPLDPRSHHAADNPFENDWQELTVLSRSLRDNELLELPTETVLNRLFHQHNCRSSPAQAIVFSCSCSEQRSAAALLQIDPRELQDILNRENEIVFDCQFCSARYRFSQQHIDQLLTQNPATRH